MTRLYTCGEIRELTRLMWEKTGDIVKDKMKLQQLHCAVTCCCSLCNQGDLKRYLRAQRKSDGMTPDLLTRDLLTLQRMAFEITSGLLHLHENNYIHRCVNTYPDTRGQHIPSQISRKQMNVKSWSKSLQLNLGLSISSFFHLWVRSLNFQCFGIHG